MSIPNPPFHSVTEELLYNIYLKIMGGESAGGLTASDIDTIAKLNAIITDADVATTAQIEALLDNVPTEGNTLNKLYNIIRGLDHSPPSLFLDFDVPTPNLSLVAFNNGGGLGATAGFSTFGVNTTENCYGVLRLSTGASTAGGSLLSTVHLNIVAGIGYKIIVRGRIGLDILSDGTETYHVYYGLGRSPVTILNPPGGIFFRYTHSANGGRWEAVCRSAGVETAVDTGHLAEINTFHVFEFRVNPEGTSVEFYIDDMTTPVATIIDNIPSEGSLGMMLFGKIEKTAGATARNSYFDYIRCIPSRTSPR